MRVLRSIPGGHGKGNVGTLTDYSLSDVHTLTNYALDSGDPNYDPSEEEATRVYQASSWC